MHFFVTGATGFIGSHFVNQALLLNHKVTALARTFSTPRVPYIKEPIWCRGELTDDWDEYLKKCDVFVHFAAAGVTNKSADWQQCFEVNFINSEIILRNALKAGIKQYLICGTCFEYGRTGDEYEKIPVNAQLKPFGAYPTSKAAASLSALEFAKENDIQLLLARLFHIYGTGEDQKRFWASLVKAAKKGEDFKMTAGAQRRNFTPVSQAATMLIELSLKIKDLKNGGTVKNVGSSTNISLLEFAKKEWEKLNATGELKSGYYEYRNQEVMSYIPII